MTLALIFMVTLMLAVLTSGLAHRSVLSTAVLFLIAGWVAGPGGFGWVRITPTDHAVRVLLELTLFAVLFTDGTQATLSKIRRAWRLPGRALLLGLPATILLGGAAVMAFTSFDWTESMIVGAVLSPTDPVFAAAIIGAREVPKRLRHLLHVESGVNDGLALPVVLVLTAVAAHEHFSAAHIGLELVVGTLIGVIVPWLLLALESSRWFEAHGRYQPLNAFAIAGMVYVLCHLLHANPFLAAFAAGVTVGSKSPQVAESFHAFGEGIAELLKLGSLLIFGALLSTTLFTGIGWGGWVAVALLIVAARPLALAVALARSELTTRERLAASWFGPKGFASVAYGLLVLTSNAEHGAAMFNLIAATVAVSIVAHSSTDILVGRLFHDPQTEPECDQDQADADQLEAWDHAAGHHVDAISEPGWVFDPAGRSRPDVSPEPVRWSAS